MQNGRFTPLMFNIASDTFYTWCRPNCHTAQVSALQTGLGPSARGGTKPGETSAP